MGDLTYAQLSTELNAALGNNRLDLAARIPVALNIAQTRIARNFNWTELQDLQNGTLPFLSDPTQDKFMPVPTNLRSVYSFRLVDLTNGQAPRKLEYVQQNVWDEKIPNAEYYTTGYPSHYTIWQDRFELWKIPDIAYAYEIRFTTWPTPFTGIDSLQTSDLRKKDDAIIALAASWMFQGLREMEEAGRWWTVYKDIINDATGLDTEKPAMDILPAFEQGFGTGRGSLGPNYWQDPFFNQV